MWWIILGVVTAWTILAVIIGVRMGRAIRTADIEDEAAELRRDVRGVRPDRDITR